MKFNLARLREPSTYAGIAGVIGSLSFMPYSGDVSQTITAVGAFVVSMLAIWLPEKKA